MIENFVNSTRSVSTNLKVFFLESYFIPSIQLRIFILSPTVLIERHEKVLFIE